MGMQDRLLVELFLVAEVIVDRRQVRPRPVADGADRGPIKSLFGELLARGFQQSRFCLIECHSLRLA